MYYYTIIPIWYKENQFIDDEGRTILNKQRKHFTATEMIVAFGIMALIIGMSVSLPSVLWHDKVHGSSIGVWKQLHLARTHAISKGRHVAVILPDNTGDFKDDFPERVSKAVMPVYCDEFGAFEGRIEGVEMYDLYDRSIIDTLPSADLQTVTNCKVLAGGSPYDISAIIFSPQGSLTNTTSDYGPIQIRDDSTDVNNRVNININWITGKAEYEVQ